MTQFRTLIMVLTIFDSLKKEGLEHNFNYIRLTMSKILLRFIFGHNVERSRKRLLSRTKRCFAC